MLGKLFVGCAGFNYDHWRRGVFFPRGLRTDEELQYYTTKFNSVEINNSFYGLPSEKTVTLWSKVPDHFIYSIKCSQVITHEKRLQDVREDVTYLLDRCALLGKRLGPILVQLPPSLPFDARLLQDLALSLPASQRFAFEFRHLSWFCDECYQILRQNRWACVSHKVQEHGIPEADVVTSDFVYMRLHGEKPEHDWDYSDEALDEYAKRIVAWRKQKLDCYVYFLNDADGRAPKNARDLLLKVSKACGEEVADFTPKNAIDKLFGRSNVKPPQDAAAAAAADNDGDADHSAKVVHEMLAAEGGKDEESPTKPTSPLPSSSRTKDSSSPTKGSPRKQPSTTSTPNAKKKKPKTEPASSAAQSKSITSYFSGTTSSS